MFHFYQYGKIIRLTHVNFIEEIKPNIKDEIIEFSDEKIIIRRKKWYLNTFFEFNLKTLICFIVLIIFFSLFNKVEEAFNKLDVFLYYLLVLYTIINIVLLGFALYPPKKEIVFDRLNSVIILPKRFSKKKKIIKLRLMEGYFTHSKSDGIEDDISSSTTKFYLKNKYDENKYLYKKTTKYNTTSPESFHYLWYFIIWYMDKNRALPQDKEFDKFREKDYQRRKKEGFLKPLIDSEIKIEDKTYANNIITVIT
ncbi:hypothetical protein [Tenacibaculum sp. SDUM215027]|uniref:hypothetical protein n=1 Tax=Tenacibaculum sp. SDUM215027 TaxID=3422596 RepID=UPI003D317CEC